MADIEFLDGGPQREPSRPPAPRPAWRRWAQRGAVAAVAAAAVTAVFVDNGDAPATHRDTVPPVPAAPHVHIGTYTPWHERAIPYGGGSYIY